MCVLAQRHILYCVTSYSSKHLKAFSYGSEWRLFVRRETPRQLEWYIAGWHFEPRQIGLCQFCLLADVSRAANRKTASWKSNKIRHPQLTPAALSPTFVHRHRLLIQTDRGALCIHKLQSHLRFRDCGAADLSYRFLLRPTAIFQLIAFLKFQHKTKTIFWFTGFYPTRVRKSLALKTLVSAADCQLSWLLDAL